jgi:hypothetical protein
MWEKGKNNNEGDWRFINLLISPSPLPAPFYFLLICSHMVSNGSSLFIIFDFIVPWTWKMRLYMLFSEKLLKIRIVLNNNF